MTERKREVKRETATTEAMEETAEAPKQESGQPTLETPTSSNVGKQTLTKADLGYDVTEEGVPDDSVALASPEHPGDPSAKENEEA
jgi:hypothetical protein